MPLPKLPWREPCAFAEGFGHVLRVGEAAFRGDGVEFRRPLAILCQILADACFSRTWIALFQFRSVGSDLLELKETLIPANFGAAGF